MTALAPLAILVLSWGPPEAVPAPETGTENRVAQRCGRDCLYVALLGLGKPLNSVRDVERRLPKLSDEGYSLLELRDAARSFGVEAECGRIDWDGLAGLPQPSVSIAWLRTGHFVIFKGRHGDTVSVVDPPHAEERDVGLMDSLWDGTVLTLSTRPIVFPASPPPSAGSWRWPLAFGAAVLAIGAAVAGAWRRWFREIHA